MTTASQWLTRTSLWQVRRPILAAATTLGIILALVLTPDTGRVQAAGVFSSLRSPGEAAFIAGHRGDKGGAPENTLPAFQLAIESAADFVETDVQLTSDGIPILMHDWLLDRTTNGTGPVWERTAEDIAALDAGSWFSSDFAGTRVPTLEQFLDLVWDSPKRAILELKGSWNQDQVGIVAQQVRSAGMQDRVLLASFDLMTLQALAQVAPGIPRVIIAREVVGDPAILAGACDAVAIVTSRRFLESHPDAVSLIHNAGLGVLVYTVNNEDGWSEAISLGVDGIITDTPSDLQRWLDAPSL